MTYRSVTIIYRFITINSPHYQSSNNHDNWLYDNLLSNKRGFKIANLNINSLLKHIDELRLCLTNQQLDILGINETKMDSDVPLDLISLEGYTWVSKNRNRPGGGVGFYLRNSINFLIRPDLGLDDIEALTIEIHKYKTKPFLVTTWYRPPNSPIDLLANFENILRLIDIEEKESIIMGDLNCDLLHKDLDHMTKELNFITNLYQYNLLIHEPTRETMNTSSLIDHFYTNKKDNIIIAGTTKITISDHYLIHGIKSFPSSKGEDYILMINMHRLKPVKLEKSAPLGSRNNYFLVRGIRTY